ncbi:MAG: HEAT repeat domain-containing protein [Planctomycetes bacterium]|nr:HEAT repeat domain-containing protein [Planctomycetota bacterium]
MRRLSLCFILILSLSTLAGQPDKKGSQVPDGLKALQHPDPLVRYKAAGVLARLGKTGKFAIPELRAALKDKDVRVRIKVAEALWKVEKPPASVILPVLLAAFKDKTPSVRAAVPGVIALLGPKARPALPALKKALTDKDLDVRMETILALGELGPVAVECAPALLQLTGTVELLLLEPMISVTLGNMGAGATPSLVNALGRKEFEARRMAAYALGLIGPQARDAAPALCKVLEDTEPSVRAQAAQALGKIGKDAADGLPALRKALTDKNDSVAIEAGLALWRVAGVRDGVPVIVRALKMSGEDFIRESACKALAQIGDGGDEAQAALLAGLTDAGAVVRAAAADALARVPPSKTVLKALTKALSDKEIQVQLSVVRALGKDAATVPGTLAVLHKALRHEDSAIRIRAANSIEGLAGLSPEQTKSLVAALIDALEDDYRNVQVAAARALKKIDPRAAARAGIR